MAHHSPVKAAGWMTLAGAAFSMMAVLARATSSDVSWADSVFFRSVIHFAVLAPVLIINRINPLRNMSYALAIRSVLSALGIFCFFSSLRVIPVGTATVIQWMAPLFTCLFGFIFLKESVRGWSLAMLVLILAGLRLTLCNSPAGMLSTLTMGVAISGAVSAGLSYGLLRIASQKDSPHVIAFWLSTTCVIGALGLSHSPSIPRSPFVVSAIIAVGIFVFVYQYSVSEAYRNAPASFVAPFSLLPSVFSPIIDICFMGVIPSLIQIVGELLIVFSLVGLLLNPSKIRSLVFAKFAKE